MKRGVIVGLVLGLFVIVGAGGLWFYYSTAREGNASNITVSANETRTFKHLTLDNGLRVMLVSDPDTDKAAAAVNVFTGSWANPEDVQGLAHFLEHMLFLGTEKFPEVDGYQTFIEQNGGSNNAYTSNENTLYFFDINARQLEPAIDRFSQFFIAPLFDEDFSERERNAVQSEYAASLQSDGRRIADVIREISLDSHPASKLAVGTLETLDVPNMVSRLQAFYREHYVAENMALSVYGPQDIDTLERMVNDYFLAIRDVSVNNQGVTQNQFNPADLPLLIEIEPRRETRLLQFIFPIGPTAELWQSKPYDYIGHLIGHEGAGSLLSVLKARGLAEGVSAGAGGLTNSNSTFSVSIQLTPEGLTQWQTVAEMLFSDIALINESGVQQWIHDEQQAMNEISFQYAEKVSARSTVVSLAERLRYYPADSVLSGPFRLGEFDPASINAALENLKPDNAVVMLVHPDANTDSVSQYYQTPYSVTTLAGSTVAQWRSPSNVAELSLPEPNPFVPTVLTVAELEKEPSIMYEGHPQLVAQDDYKTVWFEQDDAFKTPKTDVHLLFESPYPTASAKNSVATVLYLRLVNDALSEVRYAAGLAGSTYGISRADNGIEVRLYGYQDKLQLLLDTLVVELVDHQIDTNRFALLKEEYLRDLRNTSEDPVANQVMRRLNEWMVSNSFSVAEQLQALQALTQEDLIVARDDLLASSHLEFLIHGNLIEQQAIAMANRIDGVIPQQGTDSVTRQIAKLPSRDFLHVMEVDHSDSAYLTMMQGDNSSLREQALYRLLSEVVSAPYFSELRTQEQLGYIVLTRPYILDNLPGVMFYIQSPTTDPALVQLYSDRFFNRFSQKLAEMTEKEFLTYKQGLAASLTEPDSNLYQLSSRYWQNIQDNNPHFNSQRRLATEIGKISLDGFERFYNNKIVGDQRRSLTIHQVGNGMQADYRRHVVDVVGYFPISQSDGWGDNVSWVTPSFNNLALR